MLEQYANRNSHVKHAQKINMFSSAKRQYLADFVCHVDVYISVFCTFCSFVDSNFICI